MSLEDQIKGCALSEGADLVGIAPVEVYSDYLAEAEQRIAENGNCLQDFMIDGEDTSFFARLSNPRATLAWARSIILLGAYAYDQTPPCRTTVADLRGKIARTYSYYPVVRQIAERLTAFVRDQGYQAIHGQDVPLKHVADRIGLGSYGRNGLLLTKQYGSYIALRAILTNAPLRPDRFQHEALCADCDICLRACPTGALYAPYKVNPALCLNPIGRRATAIPVGIRTKMRNWIRGCDICQEVCPINRRLEPRVPDRRSGFDSRYHSSHEDLDGLEKCPQLLPLLGSEYPPTIRRNAAIALANIGKGRAGTIPELETHLDTADGELAETFKWAIGELKHRGT